MMRLETPTWGAASPMPGAAYMVSIMFSMSSAVSPVMASTGSAGVRRAGSGNLRISRIISKIHNMLCGSTSTWILKALPLGTSADARRGHGQERRPAPPLEQDLPAVAAAQPRDGRRRRAENLQRRLGFLPPQSPGQVAGAARHPVLVSAVETQVHEMLERRVTDLPAEARLGGEERGVIVRPGGLEAVVARHQRLHDDTAGLARAAGAAGPLG